MRETSTTGAAAARPGPAATRDASPAPGIAPRLLTAAARPALLRHRAGASGRPARPHQSQ
jgi:hypothetical protein